MIGDHNLISEIYEAAVTPEQWPEVLERLAGAAGAQGGVLVLTDRAGLIGTACSPLYEPYTGNTFWKGRIWTTRAWTGLSTDEELDADPIYSRFLHPQGLKWTCGTVVPLPDGYFTYAEFARTTGKPPFARADIVRLDRFSPHLARAALISSRLALQQARTTARALEGLGIPAAVVAASGQLLAANGLFKRLVPRVVFKAFSRIALASTAANALLEAALATLRCDERLPPRSIAMPAGEYGPALIVHIVPVRWRGPDIFAPTSAILAVTDTSPRSAPAADLFAALFDLTPAESRLARSISEGATLRGYAGRSKVSLETARTQLKSVFAKTGARRQAELVRLLGALCVNVHV